MVFFLIFFWLLFFYWVSFEDGFVHVGEAPDVDETDERADVEGAPLVFLEVEENDGVQEYRTVLQGMFRREVFRHEQEVACAERLANLAVHFVEREPDDTARELVLEADEIPCVGECALPRLDAAVVVSIFVEIMRPFHGAGGFVSHNE